MVVCLPGFTPVTAHNMSKRKAETLLEKHGFKDADMASPAHDKICLWLDRNMDTVLQILFPSKKGTLTFTKRWEEPVMKKDQIVGFIDMSVVASWTHTDRWRLIDENVLDWADESFKKNPECLTVHTYTSFETCLVDNTEELHNGQYYAKVKKEALLPSDEGCHNKSYRLIDDHVLDWCTNECKRWVETSCPYGHFVLDNGMQGGIRTKTVHTTHHTSTGPPLAHYAHNALKDKNTHLYARAKIGELPGDIVKEPKNTEKVLFEVKSAIRSLGELLRELRFYKQHAGDTKIVVVCHDDTFAHIIKEQGFFFHKCPKWDRSIASFFN